MNAIGGYFGLECSHFPLYYPNGIYTNNCRNALRYLIRSLGIHRIYIPIYTCNVVADAIYQEGCEIRHYSLTKDMFPLDDIPKDEFIVYNNYFGVLGQNVKMLSNIYPNLIADNAQAFFSNVNCRASVYSPRKFFGLPDGGILIGNDIPLIELPQGHSYHVSSHLLMRHDYDAEYGYRDFTTNDKLLENYPLEGLSALTRSLMGNIEYENIRKRRIANFNILSSSLPTDFSIRMNDDDVPMVFPLYTKDGSKLRNKLINHRIYCAGYWPNVLRDAQENSIEYDLAKNLVAIPIDQRYGDKEMEIIIKTINN